uniref:B-cell receptor CD22 n=1 Tax=Amphiprion ocellaris TaxID=80972 RepID=A0AAQ5Y3H4_AMPOC
GSLRNVLIFERKANWDVTYTQLRMCGPKGSAVDMNCSYTYPAEVHGKENIVQTKFWYVGRKEDLQRKSSSYEGRVHYDWHYDSDCTLRITDLRVEDSAVYKFRFITNLDKFSGEPGVTLTVTVIDIRITSAGGSSTKAELRCESHCSPDDHVWLKNGQQVSEGITYRHNFQPEDNICCALKGHEDHCSPSLYAPKLPSVSVSPSAEIVEGSSVNLTCNGEANPAATYTWFKVNDRDPLSQTPQLNFRSIRSSESGQYSCTATNALGNTSSSIYINVKCERGNIVEGMTLTCSSDANPAATYTWYKENEDSPNASGQTFATTDFRAEHSGNYYCEAQNTRGRQKSTSHPVFVAGKLCASTYTGLIILDFHQLVHTKTNRKQTNKQKTPNIAVVGKKHLSIFLFNLHICSDFIHPNSFTSPDFEKLNMSDQ